MDQTDEFLMGLPHTSPPSFPKSILPPSHPHLGGYDYITPTKHAPEILYRPPPIPPPLPLPVSCPSWGFHTWVLHYHSISYHAWEGHEGLHLSYPLLPIPQATLWGIPGQLVWPQVYYVFVQSIAVNLCQPRLLQHAVIGWQRNEFAPYAMQGLPLIILTFVNS